MNKSLENQIHDTIHKIEIELSQEIPNLEHNSLFSGYTSFSLFYIMYYKLTGDENYLNKFDLALDRIYESLNEDNYQLTYCDGLTGVLNLLLFYQESQILEEDDVADALLQFDEIIINYLAKVILDEERMRLRRSDEDLMDFLNRIMGMMVYESTDRI